ncbi:MAG: bifunctional phosphopantothenoylcysteine decarboxylase/phosphopantothenate--cysteine ligase CoaBC [Acidaminococcales bacterium]|nr:bifunctional phosphopantothenoylcysteine decarboxylase/phosphopantothenate--cysteine ligase CoaBC [Acidaminococcales bacterium]
MLAAKKILLGVCGGIAVYKAVELVSRLRREGAAVKVIMTESALKFVTQLTFREISGNPVAASMWADISSYNVEHIALAEWADVFVIAPATANALAKLSCGIADDMLTTTALAVKAPIILCPAMNTNMYENPITQSNLGKLAALGMKVVRPASGRLACGSYGTGRLPEPVDIVKEIDGCLRGESMSGLKVVVTAGGTIEPIDPVRYIGNRSSGKMGYAIAGEAARRGAAAILISAPSPLPVPPGVTAIKVETAEEMQEAALSEYGDADILIKAAAVADYRAKDICAAKIKKKEKTLTLELVKNPDILKELGRRKTKQYLVGFAAETDNLVENAMIKIKEKNLDMIVANDVSMPEAGFNHDTNIVKFIYPSGEIVSIEKASKQEIAGKLLDRICAGICARLGN